MSTDGGGGSGYADRPPGFVPLAFQDAMLRTASVKPGLCAANSCCS